MEDLSRPPEVEQESSEAEPTASGEASVAPTVEQLAPEASLAVAATLPPEGARGKGPRSIVGFVARGMIAGALVTSAVVGVAEFVLVRQAAKPAPARPEERRPPPAATAAVSLTVAALEPAPPPPPPGNEVLPAEVEVPAAPAASSATALAASPDGDPDDADAFEKARRAFYRGDMWAADAALRDYQRNFPGGAFTVEAETLEIELLRARNNTATLRTRAREFLIAHPNAPAARRVRNLLVQAGGKPP
jgi:TolA-binding protein